jgi:hypothetical protein
MLFKIEFGGFSMKKSVAVFTFTLLLTVLTIHNIAVAQTKGEKDEASPIDSSRAESVNHEVQLYLLVASKDPVGVLPLPASLDKVVKQLKSTLPYSSYKLATSFLNRVEDKGSLEVSGVGSPLTPSTANSTNPTFYNFSFTNIRYDSGVTNQILIHMSNFRFGLRVPIVSAIVPGEGGRAGYPVVNYEQIGIQTKISIPEGAPTIVGTLTTNRPDEIFILVVSAKRT